MDIESMLYEQKLAEYRRRADASYRNAISSVLTSSASAAASVALLHPDPKVAGKSMAESQIY